LSWLLDGFNSYMLLLTRNTFVYAPDNVLRLVTGAMMGLSVAAFVMPFFNQIIWHASMRDDAPQLKTFGDLGRLALVPLVWVGLTLWQPDVLRGPLSVISAGGALFLLAAVGALTTLLILRRDQQVQQWRDMAVPAALGVVLAIALVIGIGAVRAALTVRYALPY
jgi:hypothetical protein